MKGLLLLLLAEEGQVDLEQLHAVLFLEVVEYLDQVLFGLRGVLERQTVLQGTLVGMDRLEGSRVRGVMVLEQVE